MCGQAHPTELLSMAYGQMRLIMYLGFCTYGHGPHPTISASQRSGWQNDLHIRSGERTIVYDLALRNGRSINTGELHLILSSGSLTTLVPVFQNTATINVICGLTRVFSIFFNIFFFCWKLFALPEWIFAQCVPVPQRWKMWLNQIWYIHMVYGFMGLKVMVETFSAK